MLVFTFALLFLSFITVQTSPNPLFNCSEFWCEDPGRAVDEKSFDIDLALMALDRDRSPKRVLAVPFHLHRCLPFPTLLEDLGGFGRIR